MTDVRQDLEKLAEGLTEFAKEASYVAIGAGVLGFHRAQVRRQEIIVATERAKRVAAISRRFGGPLVGGRGEMKRRAKDFDANVVQVIKLVDTTLEPVFQRLPENMQAAVQAAREARDELRIRVFGGVG